ncbi:MAG: hypothetical protein IH598_10310 [Bacteroidales bacterium]|nr:hypothetical protein [Bacteroidales bacterium]
MILHFGHRNLSLTQLKPQIFDLFPLFSEHLFIKCAYGNHIVVSGMSVHIISVKQEVKILFSDYFEGVIENGSAVGFKVNGGYTAVFK